METYIDSNLSLKRDWKRSQKMHHDTLKNIYKKPSQFIKSNDEPVKLPKYKKKPAIEREMAIKSSNQKLLQKLVKISDRPEIKKPKFTSRTPRMKSTLSTPAQKAKAREIKLENKRLAQRLIFASASVDTRQFEADYIKTRKFKDMMAKPHLTERGNKKSFKLSQQDLFYES